MNDLVDELDLCEYCCEYEIVSDNFSICSKCLVSVSDDELSDLGLI